ncbi:hypothetical protein L228DRAFT_264564 [Xylona heveae TC161]|uniref:DUF7707 domain-containing protein n=1 Tax=Xylona heveae (strain CBS 132557 / TC161) TaxID=1328760 RepID=A0A165JEL9_XYLHT|nr:hypothetical protein L228DRAFT_264564 [Xylona heveae TC161]KZF26138.1 hypothetical protein L228DRAFT_264564 [Xylona heveae TC161]
MYRLLTVVSALALAGAASAQTSIDPNSVPLSTRESWCSSETSTCPLLCLQISNSSDTEENNCQADALTYSCVCSNGASPNASQYSLTLPYFICTEWGNQCVNNCGGNSQCQSDCRTQHPCGAQDPKRVNITTTSSSAAASKTSNAAMDTGTGLGGPAATTTAASGHSKHDSGAAILKIGQAYGLGILTTGIVAGFALLL